MLLSRNLISAENLNAALELQRADPHIPIGSLLKGLCGLTDTQIAIAVAAQWACPFFPESIDACGHSLYPRVLQEKHNAAAARWVPSTSELYVGFTQSVNYSLLFAVEKVLGCHTRPVIITDANYHAALMLENESLNEVQFNGPTTVPEIVRSLTSYCEQTDARELQIAACEGDLWARLVSVNRDSLDLLFLGF